MAALSAVKQEQVAGYPFAVWAAAFNPDAAAEAPADPDGSIAWREGRCPRNMTNEEFGRIVAPPQIPWDLAQQYNTPPIQPGSKP